MTTNRTRNRNKEIGRWGEGVALEFFKRKGYQLMERNYRTADGEIDLIVAKDGEFVFVEVKTRRSLDFGTPEEAVDDDKLEHLEAAVGRYLEKHIGVEDSWRLDVISVVGAPGCDEPEIEWFENVLTP